MAQQQPAVVNRYKFSNIWRLTALAFVMLSANIAAFAQQDLARLDGTVNDQQGAAVAGATVTISSAALAVERTGTSSEDGTFSIPQLRPGVYTITVAQNGFKTTKVEALELGVGQTRTFDVALEPGQVDAIVDVSSTDSPATIDTGSARMGVNVTAREVADLPVNGRTYSQLYLTAPGATNAGTGNANEIRFNGRSNQQNQVRYDGIESSAIFDASPGYVTVGGSQFRLQNSLETIQEFRVDSSVYPAEYGTGTGGQINVVGKQGTNNYRGSLYYYGRNDRFDARNFFDGEEASKLRLNQFGGSLGGRVIRDRLFFFASYEGLRQRAGFNIIELTPSNFVRDFVNFYGTTDIRGEAGRAALGISASDANAALARIQTLRATGVVNAFPTSAGTPFSLGGVSNGAQFAQLNSTQILDEDVFNVRFDGKVNDNLTYYARLNAPRGDLDSPDGTTGRRIIATQKPRNFVASANQIFGTNVFNETKFGINSSPTSLRTEAPAVAGINGVDLSSVALRLGGNIVSPGVNGGTTTGLAEPGGLTRQSSAGNGRAQPVNGISYSLIDNLSVVRGNHTMKFGGEVRFNRVSFDQLGGTTLSYGNLRDFLLNQNLTAAYIGDLSVGGDFRIATNPITTFSRPESGNAVAKNRFYIAYAQDEWKIRNNITLNYGLRYEYYSPVREQNNRQIVFDAASGQLLPSDTDLYKSSKNNFGPRLGITYAPEFLGGKTVFRAGAGVFFGPGQFEDLIQPIESNVFRSSQTLAAGLTPTSTAAVANTSGVVLTGFTPRAYDTFGYRVPERVTQYSFSVQQELFDNTVLTVAYVGSQGRNLFLRSVTNTILPGQTVIPSTQALPAGVGAINRTGTVNGQTLVTNVTTVRQFDILGFALTNGVVTPSATSRLQPFGEIDYKTSGGRDRYDSLQFKIDRRFAGGLALGGQYVLAKSYGNTQGSNEAQTAQNPFSFEEEFGNNTFDVRHSANATVLYELPFGANRRFDLGSVGNAVFGGLQIGGIYNGRSGTPLDIRVTRADLAIQCVQAGGCPNGQGGTIAQGTTGRFFTPSATSPLPPGFIAVINTPGGNASRNTRRPDLIPGVNPYLRGENGSDKLFFLNPAAFAIPAAGTYGNLPRNELHGPSFHQFDLTLQKRIRLTETANFEFRTEVFNIFNRANFANPPVTLVEALPSITYNATTGITGGGGSGLQPGQPFTFSQVPNFGLINSTVGRTVGLGTSRQIQFALRLNF
jgi:hypothetical protein